MGAWRLTGRTAESSEIAVALTRAPGGVLIEGEAGLGKTRLMRHALGRAARRGRTVRLVSATRSAETIPLGALGPVLGAAPPEATGRFGLMQFARSMLAHPDEPWIVGVDDAQWLDDLSAVVLHQSRAASRRARCNATGSRRLAGATGRAAAGRPGARQRRGARR